MIAVIRAMCPFGGTVEIGATIMRGRLRNVKPRISDQTAISAKAVMVATKETALAILRQLRQYAATHADEHILLT